MLRLSASGNEAVHHRCFILMLGNLAFLSNGSGPGPGFGNRSWAGCGLFAHRPESGFGSPGRGPQTRVEQIGSRDRPRTLIPAIER